VDEVRQGLRHGFLEEPWRVQDHEARAVQAGARIVIRRGWEPIADGCLPGAQDTVITLE